jgi:hypothetical protein
MQNKAQTGLEYTINYGFALIIIGVVITAFIFILGQPITANTCTSSPTTGGITLVDHSISQNGFLKFKIRNDTGKDITNLTFNFEEDFNQLTANSINLLESKQEIIINTNNKHFKENQTYNGKIKITYEKNQIPKTTTGFCLGNSKEINSIYSNTQIGITNDTTPNYTFSTNKAGTITYSGSCASTTTNATKGENTITLNALTEGTYSNCTIKITDQENNISNELTISEFIIDTTPPTITLLKSRCSI